MSAKHTPEPWVMHMDGTCSAAWPEIGIETPEDGFMDIGRLATSHVFDYDNYDPRLIAPTFQEAPHYFKLTHDGEETLANARRIVACVNACAGISDTDLAALAGTTILQKANESADVAKQQRDELLEALQAILENDGGEGSKCFDATRLFAAREEARAAIAKATGGAQ